MYFSWQKKLFPPVVLLTFSLAALSFSPVAARHGMVASSEPLASEVGFSAETIQELQQAGYQTDFRDRIGDCGAIEIDPASGWKFGAADPRASGKAVGY